MLMTIADYASKKGIPAQTVYSWIYRGQAGANGFKVVEIGKVKLIREFKVKGK